MRSEAENKKWGTIYLGTGKEATLDSLDAMQATVQREQWNQRTQNDYLDKVRERATDRAREILGAAHTERQDIIQEARTEAEHIRLEAQAQYAKADEALVQAATARSEAEKLRAEAEALREAAQQAGFDQGLINAHDELDAFRGAMGASVAVVLQAIERQNSALFAAWREEIVELVKTCVEKGTEWALTNNYADVLRALVMESVRKLDNRHTVTLRVHPDDEAAVADMFAAARDAMPDVERWIVNGDPDVELGGLIAESFSSSVDNRIALRRALVDNVLQHLTLPEGEADVIAAAIVHEVVQEQMAHIAEIAPPLPENFHSEAAPASAPMFEASAPEMDAALAPESDPAPESLADIANTETPAESAPEADMDSLEASLPDISGLEDMAAALRAAEAHAPEFAPALPEDVADLADVPEDAEQFSSSADEHWTDSTEDASQNAQAEDIRTEHTETLPENISSLEELERELLPLPEEQVQPNIVAENSPSMDEVLAGGGFISEENAAENHS